MYSPLVAGADIIVVRDAHWAIVPALVQVAAQGARNGGMRGVGASEAAPRTASI